MLVLRRTKGQIVDVRHRSGDVLRIQVADLDGQQVQISFDDAPRNFEIQRVRQQPTATVQAKMITMER